VNKLIAMPTKAILILVFLTSCFFQENEAIAENAAQNQKVRSDLSFFSKNPPSHLSWDRLLRKYVTSEGKVNYPGIKAEKAQLDAYLQSLSEHPPRHDWSQAKRLAYWINAYNAFTVQLIVEHYPLSSITELEKPWDQPFIQLGDQSYTLNQLENEIIRPNFQEPRIHFALNCAALSCPPLLNEAYTAEELEQQLAQQTRAFINSSANQIQPNQVKISKIFDWYGEDFDDLIPFLNRYSQQKVNSDAKIIFLNYDWALNEEK
jgi:hypothetical protein